MPNFNIIKKSNIKKTYRVERIKSDFDLKIDEVIEEFKGKLDIEDKEWKIGLIVGNSGTGKTTIVNEVFSEDLYYKFNYESESVIDDMNKEKNFDDIIKTFYSVGFGSVPSWLKPYKVLSNGEKMRVDIANLLLSNKDTIIFDEFTSVVDRDIAQTSCIAINKSLNRSNKKFIAVSCHYDIIEWLEPNWIFDTNEMEFFFIKNQDHLKNFLLEDVKGMNGENLKSIII